MLRRHKLSTGDEQQPVSVKITWAGGGKTVLLARAGDDNWKGRQPMEQGYDLLSVLA